MISDVYQNWVWASIEADDPGSDNYEASTIFVPPGTNTPGSNFSAQICLSGFIHNGPFTPSEVRAFIFQYVAFIDGVQILIPLGFEQDWNSILTVENGYSVTFMVHVFASGGFTRGDAIETVFITS